MNSLYRKREILQRAAHTRTIFPVYSQRGLRDNSLDNSIIAERTRADRKNTIDVFQGKEERS
jgi:hypothetical protein